MRQSLGRLHVFGSCLPGVLTEAVLNWGSSDPVAVIDCQDKGDDDGCLCDEHFNKPHLSDRCNSRDGLNTRQRYAYAKTPLNNFNYKMPLV